MTWRLTNRKGVCMIVKLGRVKIFYVIDGL